MALHGQHTQGQNPYGNLLPPLGLPQQPQQQPPIPGLQEFIMELLLRQSPTNPQFNPQAPLPALPGEIPQGPGAGQVPGGLPQYQQPSQNVPPPGYGAFDQLSQVRQSQANQLPAGALSGLDPSVGAVYPWPAVPTRPSGPNEIAGGQLEPLAPPVAGPQPQTQSSLAAAHFNQLTQDAPQQPTGVSEGGQAFLDSPEGQLGARNLAGLKDENRRVSSVRLSPSQHRLNDENAMWDAIMARRQQQETQNAADYERAFGRPVFDPELVTDPNDPAKGQPHERAGDYIAAMKKAGIPLPGAPDSEFEDQRARVASRGKKTFSTEELVKVQEKKDARQSELTLRKDRLDANRTARQRGLPNPSSNQVALDNRINRGTASTADTIAANPQWDGPQIQAFIDSTPEGQQQKLREMIVGTAVQSAFDTGGELNPIALEAAGLGGLFAGQVDPIQLGAPTFGADNPPLTGSSQSTIDQLLASDDLRLREGGVKLQEENRVAALGPEQPGFIDYIKAAVPEAISQNATASGKVASVLSPYLNSTQPGRFSGFTPAMVADMRRRADLGDPEAAQLLRQYDDAQRAIKPTGFNDFLRFINL